MTKHVLSLPEPLYQELERVAGEHHTTPIEVFRKAMKLLLVGESLAKEPDSGLVIKERGKLYDLAIWD